ncbi:MAG: hypothetical protein IPL28_22045 [Chloroflexi bacterium]|nr:hypothetical protein [Chloroflexota bacterium]
MSITQVTSKIAHTLGIPEGDATKIVEKAIAGGECTKFTLEQWLEERFLPNCVHIDEEGYTQMCINALKILDRAAQPIMGVAASERFGGNIKLI